MKNIIKGNIGLLLVLVMIVSVCVLSGCGSNELSFKGADKEEYQIYYLNSKGTGLEAEGYHFDIDDESAENLVDEMIAVMRNPSKYSEHKSAFPNDIKKAERKLDNEVLSVYFSEEYYTSMTKQQEVLARAAYVKTVTQVPGVKYVCFYVNNQPLVDALGNTVGIMLASDFVDDSGVGADSLAWQEISIYFGNETGELLVPEKVTVGYGKNASLERVIIEQLIKGPVEENHQRTVPDTLTLLSTTTKDGICYVDFDSSLLNGYTSVAPAITVYSIVDSLCELTNISKVQITVNGDTSVNFRDSISFSAPFERNLDILEEQTN